MMGKFPVLLLLVSVVAAAVPGAQLSEKIDDSAIGQIRDESLNRSQVMETLFWLTDRHGPRVTGSPTMEEAGAWTMKKMTEWGLANVHREEFDFGRSWSIVRFSAHLVEPQIQPLIGLPKTWSTGTDGPVTADLVRVTNASDADLAKHKGQLKGKIVLPQPSRAVRMLEGPFIVKMDGDLAKEAETMPIPAQRGRGGRGGGRGADAAPGTLRLSLLLAGALAAGGAQPRAGYDIVVYGGTSAAVVAAVQAQRMGKTVVIVSPDRHLGGLSSGGLGFTDTGNKAVIGGLSREFYHRVWRHYEQPSAWTWQKREEYGNRGQGTPAIDRDQRTMWIFEPRVAERVFEDLVREHKIPVHRNEWLNRASGVRKDGARVVSITTLSGKTYRARMFIDATYEGDLMAAAAVDYHVGRESQGTYGEKWNGVQTGVLHHRHHFGVLPRKISPYIVPHDPSSGVLARISTEPPGEYGQGDKKVQAYCYRYCVTDHPDNRIPFAKPEGYDPKQYELLVRIYEAGWRETFDKFDPIPNRKTDSNNHGPFSTDNIGMNYDYPEASYERRREILKEHERYQKGWLYFVANDPRVPEEVRQEMRRWGLPKDEFKDNGGWPHQIYVREARRMIGTFVMTEHELMKRRPTPESVGMGSYGIDSHNVQRYITPDGSVQNEGDIGVRLESPYEIAFGAILPKRGQADNLLVPVCVSSSHIAFGSIRMEPVFMVLAQSAATAAALAIDAGVAVQDVPYSRLRERLLKDGQVLEYR